MASNKVSYTSRNEYLLSLPIPMDRAVNISEYQEYLKLKQMTESTGKSLDGKEVIRLRVPLTECFNAFTADEKIDDFYSAAIDSKTTAVKRTKLKTFPDYLMIQIKKFTLGDDWVPQKLDVAIDAPDEIDLCQYRGFGLVPGEEEMPQKASSSPDADNSGGGNKKKITFAADVTMVKQLMEMGFSENACHRALHSSGNSGLESALNWLFEHQSDVNFNDPFVAPDDDSTPGKFVPDPEALEMLKAMGLSVDQAKRGLKETVCITISALMISMMN